MKMKASLDLAYLQLGRGRQWQGISNQHSTVSFRSQPICVQHVESLSTGKRLYCQAFAFPWLKFGTQTQIALLSCADCNKTYCRMAFSRLVHYVNLIPHSFRERLRQVRRAVVPGPFNIWRLWTDDFSTAFRLPLQICHRATHTHGHWARE